MTLINHQKIDETIAGLGPDSCPRIILICGDSYLCTQVLDRLNRFLFGQARKRFSLETLDGSVVCLGDIIEQTTTFSFLSTPKVIVVKNIPLFSSGGEAAVTYGEKDILRLSRFMEEGIPENHFLILITPDLDRRKKIFKTLENLALVVDCTVPLGTRKADQDEQMAVLKAISREVLSRSGKTLEPNAFLSLTEQTGFHPELFSGNLDKLVSYTGNRTRITPEDVKKIVHRDKKDPIYLFTNAVLDRDPARSLFFLSSLFKERYHPLQILKALENQVRKLLMIKYFSQGLFSRMPQLNLRQMTYDSFQRQVMGAVAARDEALGKQLARAAAVLEPLDGAGHKKKGKKNTGSLDLFLAPNLKNLYPVFQLFQKSENFVLEELKNALIDLADLDHRFKTSACEERTGMENFIIHLCNGVARRRQ